MGCASSKRIDATVVDVYQPAPTSFSVFDVNAIQEPWRTADVDDESQEQQPEQPDYKKPSPILEKFNTELEEAPRTWDEVSKALEDIKPALRSTPAPPPKPPSPTPETPPQEVTTTPLKKVKRKSFSFHTLEELDTKISSKQTDHHQLRKIESMNELSGKTGGGLNVNLKKVNSVKSDDQPRGVYLNLKKPPAVESEGYKPVRDNIFLLKDRMEREKEGKEPGFFKRDPLSDFPEKCPPGGEESVVVYTTSLGGVRRTFEDCYKVRSILELHRVVFDERDVSLHGKFLEELKELVGERESVPRLFVKGRYVGGVEEVVNLNETGRLRRIWNWVGVERGSGRQGCEGCGGARFVPCLDCGGSCKVVVVVVGDNNDKTTKKERCPECNENGLVHCPACL